MAILLLGGQRPSRRRYRSMKDDASKKEAERALQAELSRLMAKVKLTMDTEEVALARIRQILQELDTLQGVGPDESDVGP